MFQQVNEMWLRNRLYSSIFLAHSKLKISKNLSETLSGLDVTFCQRGMFSDKVSKPLGISNLVNVGINLLTGTSSLATPLAAQPEFGRDSVLSVKYRLYSQFSFLQEQIKSQE